MNNKEMIIKYATELEWAIFPLQNRDKVPACKWADESTNDVRQIEKWLNQGFENFGVDCGKSNIVVLDFDDYKGNVEFELSSDDLDTVSVKTGSGGVHYFYKADEQFPIKNSASKVAKNLDIRGIGGYVVLAPSIHPNGNRYQWGEGCSPFEKELKPVPQAIIDKLKALRTEKKRKDIERRNNNVEATQLDQQKALLAVEHIPLPLDYDDWLGCYIALDDLFDEEQTLDIMDSWCKRWGVPFTKADVNKIYGFWEDSKYTVGTLIDFAKTKGNFDVNAELLRQELERRAKGQKALLSKSTVSTGGNKTPDGNESTGGNENTEEELPPLTVELITKYQPSEGGIADVWLDYYGKDVRFNKSNEMWYLWNGVYWEEDTLGKVYTSIDTLMDNMYHFLDSEIKSRRANGVEANAPEIKWLNTYKSNCLRTDRKVKGVRSVAASKVSIITKMFNNSEWLNFPNGMFSTSTFEFIPEHNREDLHRFAQSFEYVPTDYSDLEVIKTTCPLFMKYLEEAIVKPIPDDYEGDKDKWVWEHDSESALMLLRILGFAFTDNKILQHIMLWIKGEGGSGKSTLLDIMAKLFGVYAISVDINKLGQQGDQQLADLPGKRLVWSTESDKGGRVNEKLFKKLSAGEEVGFRALYKQEERFDSQATLCFAMNDLPYISDTSNSVWRRLRMVEFCRYFDAEDPNTDTTLAQKIIENELPGVFNLLMYHLQSFYDLGYIPESETSKSCKEGYQEDVNPVMPFLKDCCVIDPDIKMPATGLYLAYTKYKKFTGGQPMNQRNFSIELERANERFNLGVEKKKISKVHYNIWVTESAHFAYNLDVDCNYRWGDKSGF